MEHLFTSESLISFIVLVVLEIVLGIDNVIFVSLILNRLKDAKEQKKGRTIWIITGIISKKAKQFLRFTAKVSTWPVL